MRSHRQPWFRPAPSDAWMTVAVALAQQSSVQWMDIPCREESPWGHLCSWPLNHHRGEGGGYHGRANMCWGGGTVYLYMTLCRGCGRRHLRFFGEDACPRSGVPYDQLPTAAEMAEVDALIAERGAWRR